MASRRKKPARRPSRRPSRKQAAPAAKTPAATGSGLAPEMQAVNTYLAVANVKASIDFLERTFGFTRGVVLPGVDGQPRYAEMRHGDSVVMLFPKGDGSSSTGGAPVLYSYECDDD